MNAVEEYKKLYNEFNKEFFNSELPKIDIKIEKMKDTNSVGEFNYDTEVSITGPKNYKLDFFELKKKHINNTTEPIEEEAWDDIVSSAYIAFPKEAFDKGKYYYASILLHEMTHCWQRLVSKSLEKEAHGNDFKHKIDEINKQSNNEWRVGYTELDQTLDSDEELDYRPSDFENQTYYIMYKGDKKFKDVSGTSVIYVSEHLGRKNVMKAYKNSGINDECYVAAFVVDNKNLSKADLEASWGSSKKPYLDDTDPIHMDESPDAFYDWAGQIAERVEKYCKPVTTYKVSSSGVTKLQDNPYSNKKFEESLFEQIYYAQLIEDFSKTL